MADRGVRGPDPVRSAPVETDPRVADRLAAALRTDPEAVVVLPSRVRQSGIYFALEDTQSVKDARAAGLHVTLGTEGRPQYLHEHSAGWLEEIAMGVATESGVATVTAVATVLLMRARNAVRRGVHSGEEETVPLKLTLTRQSTTAGQTQSDSVQVEGPAGAVVEALPELLGHLRNSATPVDAPALNLPPADALQDPTLEPPAAG